MKTIADFLQQHPPFVFLPRIDLEELARQTETVSVAAGDFIFEENGEPQPFAYVLREGRAGKTHHNPSIFAR
jgi:signal-transduction protein with cAMP-binding, CBS, and nucleotidyltransferase domain